MVLHKHLCIQLKLLPIAKDLNHLVENESRTPDLPAKKLFLNFVIEIAASLEHLDLRFLSLMGTQA